MKKIGFIDNLPRVKISMAPGVMVLDLKCLQPKCDVRVQLWTSKRVCVCPKCGSRYSLRISDPTTGKFHLIKRRPRKK